MRKTIRRIGLLLVLFLGVFLVFESPIETEAADSYTAYASNGANKGNHAGLASAISAAGSYGRVRINRSKTFTTSITINHHITIDLNGYSLRKTNTGMFFIVNSGGRLNVTSSRSTGIIRAVTEVISLDRQANSKARPVVDLRDVLVEKTGNNNQVAINNTGGGLYIRSGATVRGVNNYNSIWQRYLNGYSTPTTYIYTGATIHGMLLGTTSAWGGDVYVYGGNIYNRGDSKPPFMKQGTGSTRIHLTGGNYRVDNLSKIAASGITVNASGYRIDNYNSSGPWYTLKRYGINYYDLKGGSFNPGKTPHTYNYNGTTYHLPSVNDFTPKDPNSGVTFVGWYTDASYTTGPFTYKSSTNLATRTYHPRFTYQLEFDPNDVDSEKDGNGVNYPILDPHKGVMSNITMNYGTGVTNTLPINNYTRAGYIFLGWDVDKNASTPIVPANSLSGVNLDDHVKEGKVKLYAIWAPEKNKTTYEVNYLFEDLNGNFIPNEALKTRFFSGPGAGRVTSPSIADFEGYKISNDPLHISARSVLVHGDGSSKVYLYYKLKEYDVTFDLGVNPNVTNMQDLINAHGEDNINLDNGKLTITVKYGESVIRPEFTSDDVGYIFMGFLDSINNIKDDLDVRSNFIPKKFDYTFIIDDVRGVYKEDTITQTFNELMRFPNRPSVSGLIFDYYEDQYGNKYYQGDLVPNLGNLTLYTYYRQGAPSSPVVVTQKSNTHLTFTQYNNYEYRLETEDGTVIRDFARSSTFENLDPNTQYVLKVRMDKDNADYINEPLYKEYTASTTNEIDIIEDGEGFKINNPEANTEYRLIDENSNVVNGTVNKDGTITFTNLDPETEYTLQAKVPPKGTSFVDVLDDQKDAITVTTRDAFVGDNTIVVTDVDESANKVTIIGKEDLEYSFDNGLTWHFVDINDEITFNNLSNNPSLDILVRTNDVEPSMAVKVDLYYGGIEPTTPEANHLVTNNKIEAKDGFIYYDDEVELIPVNGFIDITDVVELKISRDEQVIEGVTYLESNKVDVNLYERPTLSEADKDFNFESTNDSIILKDLNEENDYYILVDGNYVYGEIINNEVIFDNLESYTDYEIYVVKNDSSNPYAGELELAKTIKTDRAILDIDESSEHAPTLNVLDITHNSITIKLEEGYTYKFDDVVYVGDGTNQTFSNLSGGTDYEIEVMIDSESQVSNYITHLVTTDKTPSNEVIVVHDDLELSIFENQITILNTDPLYEYAVVKKGETNFDNLVFYQGEQITLKEISTYDEFNNINKEDLDFNEEYQIVIRKLEDDYTYASEAEVANLAFEFTDNVVRTNKQTTPNVKLPTGVEIEELKDLLSKNYHSFEMEAHEGYEYVYMTSDQYLDGIDLNDLPTYNEILKDGVNIGDIYFVYGRKLEDDKHEVSEFFLIDEVIITKEDQNRPEIKVPVVYVGDDNVVVEFAEGYDYSLDGVNWIKGFNGNYRFGDLEGTTEYHIFVRNSETETHNFSEPKLGATIITTRIEKDKMPLPEVELEVIATYHNSFVIETEPDYEYSIDGINYYKGRNGELIFSNLEEETSYEVFVRYPESEHNEASNDVSIGVVTTLKEKPNINNAFYDLEKTEDQLTFTTVEGYQYSYDGGITWETEFMDKEIDFDGEDINILVRRGPNYTPVEFNFPYLLEAEFDELDKDITLDKTSDTITVVNPKDHLEYALYIKETQIINEGEINEEEIEVMVMVSSYLSLSVDTLDIIFDELDPNTEYYVYSRVKETETNLPSLPYIKETKTDKLPPADLTVFEKNVKDLEYDESLEELTFTIKDDLEGLEYSYDNGATWHKIDDLNKVTHGNDIHITITDVEDFNELLVRRSETETHEASDYSPVTNKEDSTETEVPVEMVVEVDLITDTSFTIYKPADINDIEHYEFSIDGINWHTFTDEEMLFDNLNPNTTYQLYVREKDTNEALPTIPKVIELKLALDDVFVEDITTLKTFIDLEDEQIVVEKVTDEGIYISINELYEYSLDGGLTWKNIDDVEADLLFFNIDDFTKLDYEITVRVKDNDESYSDEVTTTDFIKTSNYEPIYVIKEINDKKVVFEDHDLYDISRIINVDEEVEYQANKLKSAHYYYLYVNLKENQFLSSDTDLLAHQDIGSGNMQDVFLTDFSDEDLLLYVEDGIIQPNPRFEYLVGSSTEYVDNPDYILDTSYKARIKETDKYPASSTQDLVILEDKFTDPNPYISIITSTSHTINLTPIADQEYSVDGGLTWLSDPIEVIFTDLTPSTEYEILTRIKKSGNTMASDSTTTVSIMTKPYEVEEELLPYAELLEIENDQFTEDLINDAKHNIANLNSNDDINNLIDNYKSQMDEYVIVKDTLKDDLESIDELKDFDILPEFITDIINDALLELGTGNYNDEALVEDIFNNAKEEILKALILDDNKQSLIDELTDYNLNHDDYDLNSIEDINDIIIYVSSMVEEDNLNDLIDLGKTLIDDYYLSTKEHYELTLDDELNYTHSIIDLENILEQTVVKLTVNVPFEHEINELKVNGIAVSHTNNTYQFIIKEDTTVTVTFTSLVELRKDEVKDIINNYIDNPSNEVLDIINNNMNLIDDAETINEVDTNLEHILDLIDEQLVFEAINRAKDQAIEELLPYQDDASLIVLKLIDDGINEINEQLNVRDLDNIVSKTINNVIAQQELEALNDAITNAKTNLNNFADDLTYSEDLIDDLLDLIDSSLSIEEVNDNLNYAIEELKKNEVKELLDAYNKDHNDYNVAKEDDIEAIIDYVINNLDEDNFLDSVTYGESLIDSYYEESLITYDITILDTDYISVNVDLAVKENTLVLVSVTLKEDSEVLWFKVNDTIVTLTNNTYEFIITEDVTLDVEFINLLELAKTQAINEINNYLTDPSAKSQSIIATGENLINDAATIKEVEDYLENVLVALDNNLFLEAVEAKKDEIISNYEQLKYSEDNYQIIENMIVDALTPLREITAVEDFDYTESLKDLLDQVLTLVDEAKENMRQQLVDHVTINYNVNPDSEALSIIEAQVDLIDEDNYITEYDNIYETGKDLLDDYYLEVFKQEMIDHLENEALGYESDYIDDLLADLIADLNSKTNHQDLNDAYNQALDELNNALEVEDLVNDAKDQFMDALNDHIKDIVDKDDLEDLINDLKDDITKDNYETINDIINNAITTVEDAHKDNALNILDDIYTDASDAVKDIIDDAKAEINQADFNDVEDILNDALFDITVTEASEYFESELKDYIKDVENKDHLEVIINNLKDNVDETNYLDVEDLIVDAKEDLDNAHKDHTKDLLDDLYNDGTDKIKDIIVDAKTNIDGAGNIDLIENLYNDAIVDINIEETKENLEDDLKDYIKDIVDKDDLENLIEDLVDEVNITNYEDYEGLLNSGKDTLLNNEIDKSLDNLEDYYNNLPLEHQDLLTDEYNNAKDDLSNLTDINEVKPKEDTLIQELGDTLEDKLLDIAINDAKDELKDALDDYINDVVDKDHLENLIDDLVDQVDESNYNDILDLIDDGIRVLEDAHKDYAKDKISENYETSSDKIKDFIDDVKDEIDQSDFNEVEDILNNALIDLGIEETKENLEDDLKDYIKDIVDKDDLENLIEDLVDEVNITNYEDYEGLLNSGKDTLLNNEIDKSLDNLEDYYNNLPLEHQDLLTDEYNNAKDDLSNLTDINEVKPKEDTLIQELGDTLEDKLLDIAINDAKDELKDALDDYINDVVDKDHLENLIDDLVDQVDVTNYLDVEDLINSGKDTLLNAEKDKAKDDLDTYEDSFTNPSDDVTDIISDGKDLIDSLEDISNIKDQLDDTKQLADEQYFLDSVNDIKDELNSYVDEDSSDELKDLVTNLFDELDQIDDIEDLDDFLTDAINQVKDQLYTDSLVDRIDTENFDEDFDYEEEDEKDLIGFVTNEDGISNNYNFFVTNVDLDIVNVELIDAHIINNNLSIINDFTTTEALLNKKAYAQLEIKLVDDQGNELDKSLFKGTYNIKFLLPESLRGYENLLIVYIDSDNNLLEVFDTSVEDNWVNFQTDHFSNFYLIGDPVREEKLNLWWLIITLIILIAIEVVVIVLKKLSDSGKNNNNPEPAQANALVLPLLVIIVPKHAWLVITILLIIFLLLLAYIIYLFLKFERKPEEEPEVEQEPIPVVEEPKIDPSVPAGYVRVKRTIYNYSFTSRLHLNKEETDLRYNELKNYLLSYEGVSNNMSWKQETFTVKGKMVVKLRLQGKTMRVYLGLEPEQFVDTKYNIEDNSNVKSHQTTPTLQIVRGPVQLMHAKELIDLYMKEHEINKNEQYEEQDFTLEKFTRLELIEMELIKVQNAEFIQKTKNK